MLIIVVAMTPSRLIGVNNQLPWGHMPADLQHFKAVTLGKPVIMGRKTYESIGRPLPKRQNIIVSRQSNLQIDGCEVVHSLDEALAAAGQKQDIMVIGGGEIFKQALPMVEKMYITLIDYDDEGGAYFPPFDEADWRRISSEQHPADALNPFAYEFVELVRK